MAAVSPEHAVRPRPPAFRRRQVRALSAPAARAAARPGAARAAAVRFYRERAQPDDRRSPFEEVDFVAEWTDGKALPVEVKLRRHVEEADFHGMRQSLDRYRCDWGIVATRDTFRPIENAVMLLPARDFLLAYWRRAATAPMHQAAGASEASGSMASISRRRARSSSSRS